MPDWLPVAIWLLAAISLSEYGLELADPDSDRLRWGQAKNLVTLRIVVVHLAAGLALLPLLSPFSCFALVMALLARECLRSLLLARSGWGLGPMSRELIFGVLQWLTPVIWLIHFGSQPRLFAWVPWSKYYGHPVVLKSVVGAAGLGLAVQGGAILVRALLDQVGKGPVLLEGENEDDRSRDQDPLREAETQEAIPARPDGEVPDRENLGHPSAKKSSESAKDETRTGRVIGQLERILIFGMVLVGQWTAVGFILTAKSVARYKELEKKEFAEYYLLGTLASTLVALTAAVTVRFINQQVIG